MIRVIIGETAEEMLPLLRVHIMEYCALFGSTAATVLTDRIHIGEGHRLGIIRGMISHARVEGRVRQWSSYVGMIRAKD